MIKPQNPALFWRHGVSVISPWYPHGKVKESQLLITNYTYMALIITIYSRMLLWNEKSDGKLFQGGYGWILPEQNNAVKHLQLSNRIQWSWPIISPLALYLNSVSAVHEKMTCAETWVHLQSDKKIVICRSNITVRKRVTLRFSIDKGSTAATICYTGLDATEAGHCVNT